MEGDFNEQTIPGHLVPETTEPAGLPRPVPPLPRISGETRPRPCIEIVECPDQSLVGKVFVIEEGGLSIGRRDSADMRLADASVSRDHARIFVLGGQVALADLASTNGTFVNNVRIQRSVLQVGDLVRIGRHTLARFQRETARWALRLTDALIAARVALFEWTPTSFDASRNFAQVTGIAPTALPRTPQEMLELVHPEDRSRATQAIAGMLATGSSIETEVRFLLPSTRGDTCFSFKVQPRRGTSLAGSIANVTARKRVEREIQRLTLVLENMVDAVVVLDVEGRITDWTARAEAAFALTRDQALGTAVADLVGAHHLAAMQKGVSASGSYTAEIEVPRSAGGPGVFEVAASSLKDDDGWVVGYVAAFRDITDRKRLERQVLINDRLAAVGTLAGGIAHEINNPLSAISGGIDWLSERLVREPGMREVLDEIRHGAARIAAVVKSMRAFSRTDDHAAPRPVQLARVIELAHTMVANEVRQLARLSIDVPDSLWIIGDESRLMQVFMALLLNALHAIEAGDPARNEIRIAVEAAAAGVACVTVHDTGAGMTADTLSSVFTPFFTTKGPGKGSGLGLSVARTIVESAGGSISLQSAPGAGTTVELRLRLASPLAGAAPAPARAAHPSAPGQAGSVLIIDDEPMVAKALSRLLRSRGYQCEIAPDGEIGVALALSGRFDAIICDLMMPDMSGVVVHDRIARERPAVARRMVFVTGGAFTARERAFADSGEHRVVAKPWLPEELVAAIEQVSRSARSDTGAA
ncbi:MAG TPA: ATP-binding protein [Kofleriaceae bacterium]|nr:ATP-binding protein [Kofleriaceae bacterium]